MNQEIKPQRIVAAENVNLEIVSYKCINCGASMDGASGQCKFCDTKYQLETTAPMREDDGIWIKVKPNFPDRLLGGSLRDNEKEAKIEANIFDKVANFYQEQVAKVGKDQTEAFLRLMIHSASQNGVSIRGYMGEGSALDMIKRESHEATRNQSNILRLLPELVEKNNFWSEIVASSFDKRSGFDSNLFNDMKRSLEKNMGYWVLYGGESTSGSTSRSETQPSSPEGKWKWLRSIFGKGRTDE